MISSAFIISSIMLSNFSGYHFSSDIILQAVCYYVSYTLSYRKIEEIIAEFGINADHSTINRRIITYALLLEHPVHQIKNPVTSSWRMDETYINVQGQLKYYYLVVNKCGNDVNFLLCDHRDGKVARALFIMAIRP